MNTSPWRWCVLEYANIFSGCAEVVDKGVRRNIARCDSPGTGLHAMAAFNAGWFAQLFTLSAAGLGISHITGLQHDAHPSSAAQRLRPIK